MPATEAKGATAVAATITKPCLCCKQTTTQTGHCEPVTCRWFRCNDCGALNDYRSDRHSGGTVTKMGPHDHVEGCSHRAAA